MTAPRLAISNIAWPAEEEAEVARALQGLGVAAVEIAPTKVFKDPTNVSDVELGSYVSFWSDHGIEVVAFQSMLFGREDLTLFQDASTRRAAIDHLARFVELAGRMDVGVLVFGSPRNRQVPDGATEASVWPLAVEVFSELGAIAAAAGTCLCIEPNPPQYACSFVTTAAAGARLVEDVNHPGFGLHLDAAGMTLAGDHIGDAVREHASLLRHYHVSAPQLGEIENMVVDHAAGFSALGDVGYQGAISIEMRPGSPGEGAARAAAAIDLTRSLLAESRGEGALP
ncbi:L-ribulose 3-epimerase [Demequina sediminis]|uniref:L-ribulose 3-epimerase n=1 Tax=Demequina sediminis TaxID=1930058 RepID=A0ABP9WEJ9_9MICO